MAAGPVAARLPPFHRPGGRRDRQVAPECRVPGGARRAALAQGRCLSYGDAGITYWPVVEIVSQLGQRPSDPRAAAALASLLGEAVAVALAEPTDMLGAKADAFVDLAEVLAAAGRREDAAEAVASAEALYAAKGHLVGVARAQSLLTALRAPVT